MMNEDLLILLLLILTIARATEASPLPGYTDPATVVGAIGDGKRCGPINYVQGGMWWGYLFVTIVLVALTGLLAGLTLAVMSVDLARLKVWTEVGEAKQKCVLSIINSLYGAERN